MTDNNPYSAPITVTPIGDADESNVTDSATSLGLIARETFIAWEKLRLIYNGVLFLFTAATVTFFHPELWGLGKFWMLAMFGAIFANLCYFAGPIVDTYVSWLGFRSKAFRQTLFWLGALTGSFLAFVSIAALSFSFMNLD